MNRLTPNLCKKLAKGLFRDAEFFYEQARAISQNQVIYRGKLTSEDIRNKILHKKAEMLFMGISLEYYIKSYFLLKEFDIFVKTKPQKFSSRSYFDINTSKYMDMKPLINHIQLVFPKEELYIPLKSMRKFKRGLHLLREIRNQEIHSATYLDSKSQFMHGDKEKVMLTSFHTLRNVLEKELKNLDG
ncbi:MAG: hypothetical protein L6408_04260 [Nanoarchaeota archaeon]|nr:hypothetical protein [Nanoarchaeota archaeon]